MRLYKFFSSNNYESNDKVILRYFQKVKRWINYVALFAASMKNLKILKYYTSSKKHWFFLCSKCGHEGKKTIEPEETITIN